MNGEGMGRETENERGMNWERTGSDEGVKMN